MTKDEIKTALADQLWEYFSVWMNGQTVGANPDGSYNYYSHDVADFQEQLEKHLRKKEFYVWD